MKEAFIERDTHTHTHNIRQLVSWYFEPSQPQRITSGLANKAEIRPGKTESESGELSGEFMENNTVEMAIMTETDTRTEKKKKEWASSVGVCQRRKTQHPHRVKVSLVGT